MIPRFSRGNVYNQSMFRFYKPIEVRFSDLDVLGHVNNARYLTYMEQARVAYFRMLRLRKPNEPRVGFILASAHIDFRRPILMDSQVRVGVRVTRLGNKSFTMAYRLEDAVSGEVFATAETVQVSFDYAKQRSIPLPDAWRHAMASFEGIPPFEESRA